MTPELSLFSFNCDHQLQVRKSKCNKPGSPYVKITEQDGKFDSWVVLPLREFQEIYQNNIDIVRRHLFGATFAFKE
jgi:hypothetical protein